MEWDSFLRNVLYTISRYQDNEVLFSVIPAFHSPRIGLVVHVDAVVELHHLLARTCWYYLFTVFTEILNNLLISFAQIWCTKCIHSTLQRRSREYATGIINLQIWNLAPHPLYYAHACYSWEKRGRDKQPEKRCIKAQTSRPKLVSCYNQFQLKC